MSQRYTYTTADYLLWDTMLTLVHKLLRDRNYRMSLLIACVSFFGLRISDLLSLIWVIILGEMAGENSEMALIELAELKYCHYKTGSGFTPTRVAGSL